VVFVLEMLVALKYRDLDFEHRILLIHQMIDLTILQIFFIDNLKHFYFQFTIFLKLLDDGQSRKTNRKSIYNFKVNYKQESSC